MLALIDHHLDHDSALHRWHPVAKLVGIGVLVVATACVGRLAWAGAALGMGLGVILLSSLSPRVVVRSMRSLLLLIAAFVAIMALTAGEQVLWRLGPLTIHREGGVMGSLFAARAVAILLLIAGLVATTPFSLLCRSLRRLGVPNRFVQILLLAYRMNFAVGGEMESIQTALAARGFRWQPTRFGLSTFGTVLGSLLVRSLERADNLYDAMLARGYDGEMRGLPIRASTSTDVAKTLCCLVAAAILIGGQYLWP